MVKWYTKPNHVIVLILNGFELQWKGRNCQNEQQQQKKTGPNYVYFNIKIPIGGNWKDGKMYTI